MRVTIVTPVPHAKTANAATSGALTLELGCVPEAALPALRQRHPRRTATGTSEEAQARDTGKHEAMPTLTTQQTK